MNNSIPLGTKFNMLTCIKPLLGKGRKKYLWLCECGNYCELEPYRVIKGKTKSCGCFRKTFAAIPRVSIDDVGTNAKFLAYQIRARNLGFEFTLPREDFHSLIHGECFYCGEGLSNSMYIRKRGVFYYNGIDRVDSSQGYTLDNCVSCCKTCNSAKGTLSNVEFLSWLSKAYNYSIKNTKT